MPTTIALIRHGITLWNKSGRYCGCRDVGLSAEGKAQARQLAKNLKKIKFDRVYSSDRLRCLQTSRIIFGKVKLTRVRALREIDFGLLEGMRHDEILKKYPCAYKKWLKDPFQNCIPRAEPMEKFKQRVNGALEKIARSNSGKNLAVVCHGGVIAIFISGILRKRNFWRYVPKAASMTLVKYRKDRPRVIKFNETRHLE
ncbi:MAG: histidine phosphatase family protein [Candidatus Omnitrophota bacterium]